MDQTWDNLRRSDTESEKEEDDLDKTQKFEVIKAKVTSTNELKPPIIIYHKTAFTKEKLESVFQSIKDLPQETKIINLILHDCDINFDIPKQIFFQAKDFSGLETLKLNFSCNSLKQSFLLQFKESLTGNSLHTLSLQLSRCRDLNPDFFKIFDDRFFHDIRLLKNLKLNFSDNSKPPESIDLKFLEKLSGMEKLEKLKLDLSKNYFQHWKKFIRLLPDLKELKRLDLNFYGCKLANDYLLHLCNSLIRCEGLEYIKIDLRYREIRVLSDDFKEIAYIEAMTSVFREKFNNEKSKFKIWY